MISQLTTQESATAKQRSIGVVSLQGVRVRPNATIYMCALDAARILIQLSGCLQYPGGSPPSCATICNRLRIAKSVPSSEAEMNSLNLNCFLILTVISVDVFLVRRASSQATTPGEHSRVLLCFNASRTALSVRPDTSIYTVLLFVSQILTASWMHCRMSSGSGDSQNHPSMLTSLEFNLQWRMQLRNTQNLPFSVEKQV